MAAKEKNLPTRTPWLLPLLFFLAAVFVPSAAANLPRLSETRVGVERDFASTFARADRDFNQDWQGFYRPLCYDSALNPPIDPDGRLAKDMYQNGLPQAQLFRPGASSLDYFSSQTGSALLGAGAEFTSYFLNMAAGASTPSTYVNQATTFADNTSTIYTRAREQGSGVLGAGYEGFGYSVGSVVGMTQIYEGANQFDLATGQELNAVDAWSRGLTGTGQLLLTTAAAAAPITARLSPAETVALRNPNVYEALYEAPISGTTRAAHRTSANQVLANQLGSDAQLSGMFNQQLGDNVLQHMQSGRSGLLNPPGTVWHHPANNPNAMQLLRTGEHTTPSLQPVLHPGGVGGFGNFYGP